MPLTARALGLLQRQLTLATPLAAVAQRLRPPLGRRRQQQQTRGAASGAAVATSCGGAPPPEDSHLVQSILSGILAPYWGA